MFLTPFHPWENQALNSIKLRSVIHNWQAALERKSHILPSGSHLDTNRCISLRGKFSIFWLVWFFILAWFFSPPSHLHLSSKPFSFSSSPPKSFLKFPFSLSSIITCLVKYWWMRLHLATYYLTYIGWPTTYQGETQENQPWSTSRSWNTVGEVA